MTPPDFLDHLLRETPSKHLINFKRSYFSRVANVHERTTVGGGIEALKGVYQSLRAAEGQKLVINVDVSNSCFWQESTLDQIAYQMSNRGEWESFTADAAQKKKGEKEPPLLPWLKRLQKNQFYIKHRGEVFSTSILFIRISTST